MATFASEGWGFEEWCVDMDQGEEEKERSISIPGEERVWAAVPLAMSGILNINQFTVLKGQKTTFLIFVR